MGLGLCSNFGGLFYDTSNGMPLWMTAEINRLSKALPTTGDDLNSLTPKAIPAANVSYNAETGSATILIPASAGTFAQARIEIATPVTSLPATQ